MQVLFFNPAKIIVLTNKTVAHALFLGISIDDRRFFRLPAQFNVLRAVIS